MSSEAQRPHAMVVDDDPVIRKVLGRVLTELGFDCLEMESGFDALDRLDEWKPILALIDVEMPGLDGFATSMKIRERVGDRIAIVIATGHGDRETIDTAFEVGGSDFIVKPIDMALLRHRIRFLMRAHGAFESVFESEQRLENAQKLAKVGYIEWSLGDREVTCSSEARRILAFDTEVELRVDDLIDAFHPDDAQSLREGYSIVESGASWTRDHRVRSSELKIARQHVHPILDPKGRVVGVSATIQDITERERAAEQIRNLSYYDGLTGLPNRRMLLERMEDLVEESDVSQSCFALLRIDIDRFAQFSTTLGAYHCDQLILELARRLEACVSTDADATSTPKKAGAILSRFGGDQFAILLSHIGSSAAAVDLATQILNGIREPFFVDGRALSLTAVVGIALYPSDGDCVEAMAQSAEAALQEAKRSCVGSYRTASADLQASNDRRITLECELREALERDEVRALYQPQWNARTGEIIGAELLARWTSPTLGPISPGEFVPIAEDSGLIIQLTEWTLRRACRMLRSWMDSDIEPLRISVNMSPRYIESVDAVERIGKLIREFSIEPRYLECEFTETAIIASHERAEAVASGLRALGVRAALDDFGTGYSSLQHLARFPIDTIKIDCGFVLQLEKDPAARTICAMIPALAHELGLDVVAEGVETEAQQAFLVQQDCDFMQGFLVAPAIEAHACIELRDQRKRQT